MVGIAREQQGVAEFFPKDSVIRRVNAEPAVMFGSGRALLLQVAHPAVAQGVADHSDFARAPLRRLQGTMEAMYAVVFGSEELALEVGERIRQIHARIVGRTYRASDTENLMWVHATLCDSALGAYGRLVGRLSPADCEAYYQQMKQVGEVFGVPRDAQPSTLAGFGEYFRHMTETLTVSEVGRHLAAEIVQPSLPSVIGVPLAATVAVHRLVAVGTTPERLRDQLGFTWRRSDQRALQTIETIARTTFALTPTSLRTAPLSVIGQLLLRRARRHVR
jgi:uncharacterized protein (DUF2236 family)